MEPLDEQMLEAALAAARDAAEIHREEAGRLRASDWEEKGTADFVTRVDLEAEETIVGRLLERFPDHEVVAEESSDAAARDGGAEDGGESPEATASAAPVRWFIDPLDGTTNWLHGYPEYAVSIAAADADGPRVGVVLNSATGETFHAVRGGGSRLDGREISVSEVAELRLALVGTGFPFKRRELLPPYLRMLDAVLRSSSGVRRGGSAALDLCDLACGRLDAFWELWLMPWDVAAGGLIVREAGGVFGPLDPSSPAADPAPRWDGGVEAGGYLGANGELGGVLAAVLAKAT